MSWWWNGDNDKWYLNLKFKILTSSPPNVHLHLKFKILTSPPNVHLNLKFIILTSSPPNAIYSWHYISMSNIESLPNIVVEVLRRSRRDGKYWSRKYNPFCVFVIAAGSSQAYVESSFQPDNWGESLGFGKENVASLHFYYHSSLGGNHNPTAVQVTQANSSAQSPTLFGAIFVNDEPLTKGPDWS